MASSALMNHLAHPPRSYGAGALVFACLLGAGCSSIPSRQPPAPLPERTPIATPVVGSAVSVDLRPFGAIQTDGVTLPLLSPNGRFLAAQIGVAPDLATALARRGQRPVPASRIAIYRLDPRGLVRLGETDGGLVLGRSADDRGFLVESVRADGSRWIGRVDWNATEPDWIVQDGRVNAFGALGPGGLLVYSSRGLTDRTFDLTVRAGTESRVLAGDGSRSYLTPCFSADGTRVFAMLLRDGILELASADPSSTESLSQSLTRFFVTDRGSDELAQFMASAQGVRDGVDGPDWILYHRSLNSLARWNAADGLRPIPGNAMAMARVDSAREAVLVGGKVRLRSTGDAPEPGTVVVEQLGVPRAIGPVEDRPAFLMFAPEGSGVRVVIARILNG